MADVSDIVTAALRELGVLAAGEVATADDAQAGLDALGRLQDQWAAERLQIYTVTRTTWTITASDGDYTVGAGANVNVARPAHIDHVNFIDTSTDPDTEYPLVPLTEDGYAAIGQKALTSKFPSHWHYNPTFPNGVLNFWPVPTASTLQGALYAPAAIAKWTSLSTSVSLPPGYERMLVKNLAVELAPQFEREVGQALILQARESKAVVKGANRRLRDLSFDGGALIQGSGGAFDIYTGQ